MNDAVRSCVRTASVVSALLGAVLSPVPMADEVALVPVYGLLALRIGHIHNLKARDIPWRPIGLTVVAGLAARATVNLGFGFVPGVAAIANAVSAVALTELVGRYVDSVCANPAAEQPFVAQSAPVS